MYSRFDLLAIVCLWRGRSLKRTVTAAQLGGEITLDSAAIVNTTANKKFLGVQITAR